MKQWKVTLKGNDTFSMTRTFKATKIEDAINEAIKMCAPLTIEMFVQVSAQLLD